MTDKHDSRSSNVIPLFVSPRLAKKIIDENIKLKERIKELEKENKELRKELNIASYEDTWFHPFSD